MQHSSNYPDFKLKPVSKENLMQVLDWRNLDHVRNNYYDNRIISLEAHLKWFKSLQTSTTKLAFVFEHHEMAVGVVTANQRDFALKTWVWGIHLIAPGLIPKMGTKMGLFGLEYLFESVNCDQVIAEVIKTNIRSQNYMVSVGFKFQKEVLVARPDGEDVPSVALIQSRIEWLGNKNTFFKKGFE